MEMKPKISSQETPETETDGSLSFFNSLQDLRELRSQLHYAADYWETTFLNAEEKRDVIENTRDYICSAVVTTVDHLGSMSAKLDCIISGTNAFSEAEFRINCLQQRLLTCEQYTDKLALATMRWSEKLPRLYSRYLSPCNIFSRYTLVCLTSKTSVKDELTATFSWSVPTEKASMEDVRKSKNIKHVLETEEDEPLLFYTCTHKPSNLSSISDALKGETVSARVLPVLDGLSALMKNPNSTFHFQVTQKIGRSRKSLHSGNILSLIRRTKRT